MAAQCETCALQEFQFCHALRLSPLCRYSGPGVQLREKVRARCVFLSAVRRRPHSQRASVLRHGQLTDKVETPDMKMRIRRFKECSSCASEPNGLWHLQVGSPASARRACTMLQPRFRYHNTSSHCMGREGPVRCGSDSNRELRRPSLCSPAPFKRGSQPILGESFRFSALFP